MVICFTSSFIILGSSIRNMNINIHNPNVIPRLPYILDEIFKDENYRYNNVNEEKTIKLDNIELISINTTSYDINVEPYDGSELKIKLSSNIQTNSDINEPQLQVNKVQNKINIETYKMQNNFFFNIRDGKLDIYIPKTYDKSLDISTVSGDGYIKNLNLSSLNYVSTSGNLNLQDMEMNNFIYKSTSSDLYANNIVLKDDNNKFSSVSGELTLENIKGNLSFNTTSGDVNFDKLLGSVSGNTISGDVDIRISKDIGLKTKLETVSGDIDVFFLQLEL